MRTPLLLLSLLALAAGCRGHEEMTGSPPLPVTVVSVAGGGAGNGARYSASLTPDVEVQVAFKVSGYVEQILQVKGADGRLRPVQDGDMVRRGTVLARIRVREYQDAERQAAAALTKSKADFDRAAQLYENRSVSKADYDAAYAKYQADQAEHDRAVQALADCALVAPLDGYVLGRSVEVGTLVSPGAPAFQVGNLRAVKVVFGVPDVMLASLRPGARQQVRVDAVPGVLFEGRYTRISPIADAASRTFEAEVTIPNSDGRLKPGMIAALEVTTGTAALPARPILVPLNAVVRPPGRDSGFAVYIVAGKDSEAVAQLREVALGDISGNQVQVTRGLAGGEAVIVRGATLAVDQGRVRVVP
ncbi:MAG: efflux RND transporter periplasmic adaptor subunit [Gemmatimonadales bacterium]